MNIVRQWLTATEAPYRNAALYALTAIAAFLAVYGKGAPHVWAERVGWALFAVLAGYSLYWSARITVLLVRRRRDRNRTYGPRVHNYRLPDGGVGSFAEGGRGGAGGTAATGWRGQDGEDGAGPYGGKGVRGGGPGHGGGGGGGRARSVPHGPRSFTYGQPPDNTHPEEQ